MLIILETGTAILRNYQKETKIKEFYIQIRPFSLNLKYIFC